MPPSLVSIIVPAFNEKNSVEELHARIKEVFGKLDRPFELIVVDDGSTDGTFEKLRTLLAKNPNITIIRHFKNRGKSLTLMQGFDVAKGEIAITLDADLQDQPEEIPNFIKKIEEGYDFVNGCRQERKDTRAKRMASKIFNWLISQIFRVKFNDINCGFKAYTRKVYQWLDLRGDLHRLIPVIVVHMGYKTTEIPVEHKDRKYGSSKYKLFRYRGLLDIIALAASSTTQIRPFHFFCELGAVLWILAILSLFGLVIGLEVFPLGALVCLVVIVLWALSLGTFLPIFGFYLEIEATRYQGLEWRKKLIQESLNSQI